MIWIMNLKRTSLWQKKIKIFKFSTLRFNEKNKFLHLNFSTLRFEKFIFGSGDASTKNVN
jgi:hypothetical protein